MYDLVSSHSLAGTVSKHERLALAIVEGEERVRGSDSRKTRLYVYPAGERRTKETLLAEIAYAAPEIRAERTNAGAFCDAHDDCFADRKLGEACFKKTSGTREVSLLVARMEQELRVNAHKGDWRVYSEEKLHKELAWHQAKLLVAVREKRLAAIEEHTADMCNLYMFFAFVHGAFREPNPAPEHATGPFASWDY